LFFAVVMGVIAFMLFMSVSLHPEAVLAGSGALESHPTGRG
jgi:hypothetical protein